MTPGLEKLLAALFVTCLSSSALAQSCALIVQERGSEVRDAAGSVQPLPAPNVAACAGLRIASGSVVACTATRRGQSICHTFKAGQTIGASDLRRGGGGAGAWYTLKDIVSGSPSRGDAVSRGGSKGSLPTGSVVFVEALAVEPDFERDPALRAVESIDVLEGGSRGVKVATLAPHAERSLPTAALKSGRAYSWRINPSPSSLPGTGGFVLVSDAARDKARQELARIRAAADGDAAAQAVMWGGWLASQGYAYEAEDQLKRAGFDTN